MAELDPSAKPTYAYIDDLLARIAELEDELREVRAVLRVAERRLEKALEAGA